MIAKAHDQIVRAFFECAGDLVMEGLDQMRLSDPGVYAELSKAVAAGAALVLTTEVTKDGILETRCSARISEDETVMVFHLATVNRALQ